MNNERICSFSPEFRLRLANRFIAFVSALRGRRRVDVCDSAGFHIQKVVFSSFFPIFFPFSEKGLLRLKGYHYRSYRLYSSCTFHSLRRQVRKRV